MDETKFLSSKAKVDEAGRILIPVEIRRALGLQSGQWLSLELGEDALRVMTGDQLGLRVRQGLRLPLGTNKGVVDDLREDRIKEAAAEGGVSVEEIRRRRSASSQ